MSRCISIGRWIQCVYKRGLYRVFWDRGYWPIFLRNTGIFCVFYFGIWGIQEFWDMGYWNLIMDTS